MPLETRPFDPAELLDSPQSQAELLGEAFEEGDPAVIVAALHAVARARGLARVAEEAGITRQGLSKALGEGGNPTLRTLLGVARALGFRISVEPIAAE